MEAEECVAMDASVMHGGATSKFGALCSHLQSHASTCKPAKQLPRTKGRRDPTSTQPLQPGLTVDGMVTVLIAAVGAHWGLF